MKNPPRLLYFIQYPPPLHGVTITNKRVYDSTLINAGIQKKMRQIKFSSDLTQINKVSVYKLWRMAVTLAWLCHDLFWFKPRYVYFTLTPTGGGFYRDVLFVAAMKFFRKTPVYHLHGKGIAEKTANPRLKKLYRRVFKNAVVIHLSKGLLEREVTALQPENARLFYVPNGIAPLTAAIPDRRQRTGPVSLLFLSNKFPSKGVFVLLEAFRRLIADGAHATLTIAGGKGDVASEEKYHTFIATNSLSEHIHYLGPHYGEDKNRLFEEADIFIHPTLNDAFPLVILEAMNYGLPVISTFEGAIPEIIENGKTGFLVPQGDAAALAERISALIHSPELRQKMGNAAREYFLAHFTMEIFEKNMRRVFEEIGLGANTSSSS